MARLNITFASLDATNKTRPQSTAEGVTYTQNLVVEGSLSVTNDKDVYKVVHPEPVPDATLPNLMAWIEENVPDYTNKLYEVYIPEIKTSNTALGPTGVAATVYSFTGTKQSDHSMIARATVTAYGTDEYPVGTVLECIIQPDLTRTDWRVVNAVTGIIEVATSTSAASRNALMQTADNKANGRDNYTIIFDSVTFTNAAESPTHSTTDVFWVEVIKTDDRIFIRTSAAINQGGAYFNRVYYSRMNLDTEAWSDWTPYNFQIMDIDLFNTSGANYNVPTIYLTEVMQRAMIFKYNGVALYKYSDTELRCVYNDTLYRFTSGTAANGVTPVIRDSIPLHYTFSTSGGTIAQDLYAWSGDADAKIHCTLSGVGEMTQNGQGRWDIITPDLVLTTVTIPSGTNKTYTVVSKQLEESAVPESATLGFTNSTSYPVSLRNDYPNRVAVIKHLNYSEVLVNCSVDVNATARAVITLADITVNGKALKGIPGCSTMIGVGSGAGWSGKAIVVTPDGNDKGVNINIMPLDTGQQVLKFAVHLFVSNTDL